MDQVRHSESGRVALLRQVIFVGKLQRVQRRRVGPARHEVAHIGVLVPACRLSRLRIERPIKIIPVRRHRPIGEEAIQHVVILVKEGELVIDPILFGNGEHLVEPGSADLIHILKGVGVRPRQQVGPPAAASRFVALEHDGVDPDSAGLDVIVRSRRVGADI